MEWSDLFAAFALYLILEGLLPFASPRSWRESLEQLTKLEDPQLRLIGLASMAAGLLLLWWVRG